MQHALPWTLWRHNPLNHLKNIKNSSVLCLLLKKTGIVIETPWRAALVAFSRPAILSKTAQYLKQKGCIQAKQNETINRNEARE